MRDTSQNLVINKQTVHPIKSLTSPCLSPLYTHSLHCSYQSISDRKEVSFGLGLTSPHHPVLYSWFSSLSSPSTCLSECQTNAPVLVRPFIFHCQVLITQLRLCTPRHAKCHICCGFVNSIHLLSKMMRTSWSYNLLWLTECCWRKWA